MELVADIKDTIRANKDLVALSAPQIGVFDRVFCINFKNEIKTFINPVITEREGTKLVREVSPSIPDKEFIVPRNEVIYASYQKTDGTVESNKFEGVASEVFQHMVNMLDGVLISDIGLEVLPEFDKASKEEQAEVLREFTKSLKQRQEELDKEIEEDEDLKKIRDGSRFINAILKGEVDVEPITAEPNEESAKTMN